MRLGIEGDFFLVPGTESHLLLRCNRDIEECGAGNDPGILQPFDDDLGIRAHAGAQFQMAVVHRENRLVGDDTRDHLRIDPYTFDARLKLRLGIGIHTESRLLPLFDLRDIRLVNTHLQLHFGKVVRQFEKQWCLKSGGNSLARIDTTFEHDSVDRGVDRRLFQIIPGGLDSEFRLRDLRFGT